MAVVGLVHGGSVLFVIGCAVNMQNNHGPLDYHTDNTFTARLFHHQDVKLLLTVRTVLDELGLVAVATQAPAPTRIYFLTSHLVSVDPVRLPKHRTLSSRIGFPPPPCGLAPWILFQQFDKHHSHGEKPDPKRISDRQSWLTRIEKHPMFSISLNTTARDFL